MKLKKQGNSYEFEYNGFHYYRMSFSETSIGSWFRVNYHGYVQVVDVNIIMELEEQFTTLELDTPTKVETLSFVEDEEVNE